MKFRQNKKIRNKIILVLGFFYFFTIQGFSQSQVIITKEYNNFSWLEFVKEIESKYKIRFFYKETSIPNFQLSITEPAAIKQILTENLSIFNLSISADRSGNFFITKDTQIKTNLPIDFFPIAKTETNKFSNVHDTLAINKTDFLKTSKEYISETIIIGTKEEGVNHKNVTISGYARNSKTGEAVINATIFDTESGKGVLTDVSGYFQITLDKGKHILVVNSVNINEKRLELSLLSDGSLDLILDNKIFLLDDVIIIAEKNDKVKGTQMGIESLTTKSVKNIPLVFGEKDLIKVALLLPGIQSIGEGSAGFNVRGSPIDQNVFYINNVPIYNTSHVSGFFSVFNSDAIDEFSLYKSNIPINYGGRLSSIFDIKTRQGDKNKLTASGGIGLITGRLLVEGPIKKEKNSFLIGVRSTYSDWAINMMVNNQKVKNSKAKFADVVSNFSFQLNDKNLLNIFFYHSYDKMDIASTKTLIDYENTGASIVWNHYFKNQNNLKLSLVHSSYKYSEEDSRLDLSAFKNTNNLKHTEIKADLNLKLNEKHTITVGINSILYNIDKGNRTPLSEKNPIEEINFGKEKGLESGIYIGDEWKVSQKLSINGGIRYNLYSYLGPQNIYQYVDGLPKATENIQSMLSFENNEFIKTYGGLDFRASARYLIKEDLSLKVSYNKLHQYIYMLSNTIAISPNYKWKLIDYNSKPIIGDQISIGLFSNIFAKRYEVSVEAYFKKTQNLVEIKDGADLFTNKYTEQVTLQGDLSAYGIELMIKKPHGDLTGWINYTYSKSTIKVDSEFSENKINFGESYNSNYDKPHNWNLVANYEFSRRFSMSGNFVYSTGRPITYPTAYYPYNGVARSSFSKRNAYRIPDYYRLDLSFTLEGNLKRNKLAHGSWTFSIYNVLGRNNAYSVYFTETNNKFTGYKLSIFAAPIYSLTYIFKLGNYEN